MIGFAEFVELVGILAASASHKVRDYDEMDLHLAMDKFINRLLSQQNMTCQPLYSEDPSNSPAIQEPIPN